MKLIKTNNIFLLKHINTNQRYQHRKNIFQRIKYTFNLLIQGYIGSDFTLFHLHTHGSASTQAIRVLIN